MCADCQGVFCERHYEPESHRCGKTFVTLAIPNGSEYELSVPERLQGVNQRLEDGNGGLLKMLIRSLLGSPVTLSFLVTMWLWTGLEFAWVLLFGATPTWEAIFVFSSENPLYVWTWITSMFSHGGFLHLLVNSFVLASFGPLAEYHLGKRKYLIALLAGGIIAGIAQIAGGLITAELSRVVGASGAIAAVLGIYATAEPDVRVYLFFLIPMPVSLTAFVVAVGSLAIAALYGVVAFNIAHVAHGVGAAFGLLFGLLFNPKPAFRYLNSIIGRNSEQSPHEAVRETEE